jgi:hypothetical protein
MKFLMFGSDDVAKMAQVSAAPVVNGRLPRGLTGGLIISFLGLLTFFGAFFYSMQRAYINYGYPETNDEWASYIGVCLFLLGVLIFVIVAPLRAETGKLIMGPAVSLLGLLTFFAAGFYAMQREYINYGYPETGDAWASYIGVCLFLLGVLIFVIVAPLRAGAGKLIIGPAVSFLGLLTFFAAYLYWMQVLINEYGYSLTSQGWALYIGTCVFLLGGLVLTVNAAVFGSSLAAISSRRKRLPS